MSIFVTIWISWWGGEFSNIFYLFIFSYFNFFSFNFFTYLFHFLLWSHSLSFNLYKFRSNLLYFTNTYMINAFSTIRVYIPNKVASVRETTFVCLNRCLIELLLNICLFPYKCQMLIVNFKYYRSNKSVSQFWVHIWKCYIIKCYKMLAIFTYNDMPFLRKWHNTVILVTTITSLHDLII